MDSYFREAFAGIGFFGPFIAMAIATVCLMGKTSYLGVYFIGLLASTLLNVVLKLLIRQPRPEEDTRIFNLELSHGKRIGFDRYGMPSAHAQSVFYTLVFLSLVLKKKIILMLLMAALAIITCVQRIVYKNHTVAQVVIGALIGTLMGWLFFHYGARMITGKLRAKGDDDAPF